MTPGGSPDELLSAEVVLRPPGGRRDPAPITAGTVAAHRPDPESAARVRRWFTERGFDTTDVYGIGFSVTGPRARFDETFGPGAAGAGELPLATLPDRLASTVESVTFSPPPDFGPTSY